MFTGTPSLRILGGGRADSSARSPQLPWLLLLGLLCSSAAGQEEGSVPKENQLKAALLYTFTKYMDWPSTRFTTSNDPIVIGIMGKSPVTDQLKKVVEGRKLKGRTFLIKSLVSRKEISSVHVLFVPAGGELMAVGDTMDLIHAPGILTVGETAQFTTLGGIITFVSVEDKVQYEVNREAANHSGVRLGQQLLKMSSQGRKKI